MKAKLLFLFMSIMCCFPLRAQYSSGGGTFPEYKKFGIVKVEEYHIAFEDNSYYKCEDNLCYKREKKRTLKFNKNGQMIQEEFYYGGYASYYEYEYNSEGFLINIDTNGRFGYGSTTPYSYEDTLFLASTTKRIEFAIDTMLLVKSETRTNHSDSTRIRTDYTYNLDGKVVSEKSFFQDKLDFNFQYFGERVTEYNNMGFVSRIIHFNKHKMAYWIEEFVYFVE